MESETFEAESVVAEIRQRLEGETSQKPVPSDFAILFRTNEQPRAFELELRRVIVSRVQERVPDHLRAQRGGDPDLADRGGVLLRAR